MCLLYFFKIFFNLLIVFFVFKLYDLVIYLIFDNIFGLCILCENLIDLFIFYLNFGKCLSCILIFMVLILLLIIFNV